jgi:hypothetical protein
VDERLNENRYPMHSVLREIQELALAKALRSSAIARSTGSLVIARPPVRGMPSTSRPIVARAIIAADHDAGDADEVIE